jgi:lysozyme family protein
MLVIQNKTSKIKLLQDVCDTIDVWLYNKGPNLEWGNTWHGRVTRIEEKLTKHQYGYGYPNQYNMASNQAHTKYKPHAPPNMCNKMLVDSCK